MSTTSHSLPEPLQRADVLGDLLHSLSQPLTSLRCSLELSMEEAADQQQKSVQAALQQTEKVIGMIQLMREYLDAEQPEPKVSSSALTPVLRSVVEDLSSIAAVRAVRLCLVGTCRSTLPVPESRLRMALQYLMQPLIEAQPEGGKVIVLLGEAPSGTVMRAEGGHVTRSVIRPASSVRRVRLAIARRVLETGGARLKIGESDGGYGGFVLRIPHWVDRSG